MFPLSCSGVIMYFFIDTKTQTVTAFYKMRYAARAALESIGIDCPGGGDPVALANAELGDRGVIMNLSAAFESIAISDDIAAQELATAFAGAVDQLYKDMP